MGIRLPARVLAGLLGAALAGSLAGCALAPRVSAPPPSGSTASARPTASTPSASSTASTPSAKSTGSTPSAGPSASITSSAAPAAVRGAAGAGLRAGRTAPATPSPRTAPGVPSARALARARVTHELPTPAGRPRVAGGWRTPLAAVRSFTATYVNWSAATVAPRLRALAAASVGQARAELSTEAAEVGRDRELQAGGIANAGTVEAVAPVAGHPREFAAVTRESTRAAHGDAYRGLAPEWHVALATVTRLPDGLWVLSGWQPEN